MSCKFEHLYSLCLALSLGSWAIAGLPSHAQEQGVSPTSDLTSTLTLSKTKAQPFAQTPAPEATYQPLHRQGSDRQPFRPRLLPLQTNEPRYLSAPGVTVITPSAYGTSNNTISVGFGFQARTRFTNQADGVLGAKLGLGDPQKSIGAEVGIVWVDLDNPGDGFFTAKLHKQLPQRLSIAVGVLGAGQFGETDSGTSVYGVISQRLLFNPDPTQPFSQMDLSVGLGNGQFRSEAQVQRDEATVGVFGGVAVRLAEPISAIAEWTGQDLTLGLSWVPFPHLPLVITPAVTDLTGNAGDGTRFILGASYSAQF